MLPYAFNDNHISLVTIVRQAFQDFIEVPEIKAHLRAIERYPGGYVTIANKDGFAQLITGIGQSDSNKIPLYLELSMEKLQRLVRNYVLHGHVLSRQSRDSKKNRMSGAVLGTNYIVSFSGLPESLDELFSALVLCRLHDFSPKAMVERLSPDNEDNEWLCQTDFVALAA